MSVMLSGMQVGLSVCGLGNRVVRLNRMVVVVVLGCATGIKEFPLWHNGISGILGVLG